MLIVFNAFVYLAAFFLIDASGALLSVLVYFVATMVIDHFTDRFEAVKQVTIITHEADVIVSDLREKMDKTCTVIDSRGAISGENKTDPYRITRFDRAGFDNLSDLLQS